VSNSINTNAGAVVALQSLNKTNALLDMTQKRVSTGYRVADARDDGGAFAVAQKVRGDIAGVTSANEQLGAAKGLLDTTLSGLNRISDTFATVKAVLVKLADQNVTDALRVSYTEQYNLLRTQIANFVNDSSYNGVTLLGTTAITGGGAVLAAGSTVNVVRNERGESLTINAMTTLAAVTAAAGPPPVYAVAASHQFDLVEVSNAFADPDTTIAAAAWREYLTGQFASTPPVPSANRTLSQVEADVNLQLNRFGNSEKSVVNQIGFNKDKIDALESGLGALIDADLAKESARLQSLQIRQQLGASALSSSNAAPQFLLSLFR
jgi:flagellin